VCIVAYEASLENILLEEMARSHTLTVVGGTDVPGILKMDRAGGESTDAGSKVLLWAVEDRRRLSCCSLGEVAASSAVDDSADLLGCCYLGLRKGLVACMLEVVNYVV